MEKDLTQKINLRKSTFVLKINPLRLCLEVNAKPQISEEVYRVNGNNNRLYSSLSYSFEQ